MSMSTASAAATLRVTVWRKLKSLGALYLQQSVCVLPAREPIVREVRRLADRARHQGGQARVLRIEFTEPGEAEAVVAEMNAARDAEYDEVLERLPDFVREIETERDRSRATYAEVEESEADLERFRSWLAKIEHRDYFGAPRGAEARRAVAEAAELLAAFEDEALSLEAPIQPQPASPASTDEQRLRVVDGA